MRARIKVDSFDTSMWGGMVPMGRHKMVYLLEKGQSIHAVWSSVTYAFKLTDIGPRSVDLLIRPDVNCTWSDEHSMAGTLTLPLGQEIALQTLSFDAWGNWIVTLEAVIQPTE
jgi:hypothetical protein